MSKFRKKPVVIDAEVWDRHTKIAGVSYDPAAPYNCDPAKHYGRVKTLEGNLFVCEGDYVITGVHGEKYACKPDIFKETHEAV